MLTIFNNTKKGMKPDAFKKIYGQKTIDRFSKGLHTSVRASVETDSAVCLVKLDIRSSMCMVFSL